MVLTPVHSVSSAKTEPAPSDPFVVVVHRELKTQGVDVTQQTKDLCGPPQRSHRVVVGAAGRPDALEDRVTACSQLESPALSCSGSGARPVCVGGVVLRPTSAVRRGLVHPLVFVHGDRGELREFRIGFDQVRFRHQRAHRRVQERDDRDGQQTTDDARGDRPAAIASTTATGCNRTDRPSKNGWRTWLSSCITATTTASAIRAATQPCVTSATSTASATGDQGADDRDECTDEDEGGQR